MLGRKLSAAEKEARDAKKIAELKESIGTLLDNMPALSFSKDAETGIYLACNQAFAEYAHKDSPEGVVGLTDAEIFDPETARHFAEDDKMALSMDENGSLIEIRRGEDFFDSCIRDAEVYVYPDDRLPVLSALNKGTLIDNLDRNRTFMMSYRLKINDTLGHKAGDDYIRSACKIICDNFKRSPVFRIGGDEFVVIVQEDDYASIEELMGRMNDHNTEALLKGGVVIACGMSRFNNDDCVATVFERADQNMYDNKAALKERKRV